MLKIKDLSYQFFIKNKVYFLIKITTAEHTESKISYVHLDF